MRAPSKSYYPWNVRALIDWLNGELANRHSLMSLSAALGIASPTIKDWLTTTTPDLTLDQVYAIARYRAWSLTQTFNWLGLKPAHIDYLMTQSPMNMGR